MKRRLIPLMACGLAACGGSSTQHASQAAHAGPRAHTPGSVPLGTTLRFHSVPGLGRPISLRLRAASVLDPGAAADGSTQADVVEQVGGAPPNLGTTRLVRFVNVEVTIANRGRTAARVALQGDETDPRGRYTFVLSPDNPSYQGPTAREPNWADHGGARLAAGAVSTRWLTFAVAPGDRIFEIVVVPVLVGRSGAVTALLPDHATYALR